MEYFVLGENCQVFESFSVKCGGFVCCKRCEVGEAFLCVW